MDTYTIWFWAWILEEYLTKNIGTLSTSKRLISQKTLFVPEAVMRNTDEGWNKVKCRGLSRVYKSRKRWVQCQETNKSACFCVSAHRVPVTQECLQCFDNVCLEDYALLYLIIHCVSFYSLSILMLMKSDFRYLYFLSNLFLIIEQV